MRDLVWLRKGVYHDSVSLMRVSRALGELPGMTVAVVAMATELNLSLARDLGFAVPAAEPGDLLVALRGGDPDFAAQELDRQLAALSQRPYPGAGQAGEPDRPPLTTRSAARRPADLVLVSVPGEHAFGEALDAVEAGLPVMIFSDGVPLAQERRLKELADQRDVLVMGPDCGTAAIAGVGLGFSNVLSPGPVGLVAASGTGAQQVTCLLDRAGVGVSHVLGVGGRDLSSEVGGLSTLRALRLLDDDPATELIVLVSKPPAPDVASRVRTAVSGLRTPVVLALLGEPTEEPAEPGGFGGDLTWAAEEALRRLGRPVPEWPYWPGLPAPPPAAAPMGTLRGVYSGGTLKSEAELIAGGGDFVDYGDDAFTRGRAHPMIDPTLRVEALAKAREGDVVLMDVVLGHGADPDPAAALAPAVARTPATVVIALIGAAGDPQDPDRQAAAFSRAGAAVFVSNAQAARYARTLL
ncbi:FdrA family protein [Nonomuraea sp. NN258]|nr:FdrA family protein [Nonomuraea antri]